RLRGDVARVQGALRFCSTVRASQSCASSWRAKQNVGGQHERIADRAASGPAPAADWRRPAAVDVVVRVRDSVRRRTEPWTCGAQAWRAAERSADGDRPCMAEAKPEGGGITDRVLALHLCGVRYLGRIPAGRHLGSG